MKNFNRLKTLTLLNTLIVLYFAFLYLAYIYQINFTGLQFIVELITFPLMAVQLVLLAIGIGFFVNKKPTSILYKISVVALAICSILTIGSFFI